MAFKRLSRASRFKMRTRPSSERFGTDAQTACFDMRRRAGSLTRARRGEASPLGCHGSTDLPPSHRAGNPIAMLRLWRGGLQRARKSEA